MSTFIEKNDYASIIKDTLLDDITEVDDEKIDACENRAIEFIAGYLNSRYDVTNIFNKTGDLRNKIILGFAMDITIYYLHRISNWRNCPSARTTAYNEAKEWLEKVSAMRINPRELPVLESGQKDYIQMDSNTKRVNHI